MFLVDWHIYVTAPWTAHCQWGHEIALPVSSAFNPSSRSCTFPEDGSSYEKLYDSAPMSGTNVMNFIQSFNGGIGYIGGE